MKILLSETIDRYAPPRPKEQPPKEPPDVNNPPNDDEKKSPFPGKKEPTTEKPIKEPPKLYVI